MGIAESKALRNLLDVYEFTLPQAAHPGARARQREDECLVDPTGLRHGIARNEDLLALAGTVRRESKPKRAWAVALIAAVDTAIALELDFNTVVMDDNAINRAAEQLACLGAPDPHIGDLTFSRLLSAQLFDDNSLDLIGPDAGSRTWLAAAQLRLADVITVAVSPAHRIGR